MGPQRSGLSRKAKVTFGNAFAAPTTLTQGPDGRAQRIAKTQASRNAEISSMLIIHSHCLVECQAYTIVVMDMAERQDLLHSTQAINEDIEMDGGDDEDVAYMHPPPGAEGADHSHAGDEEMVSGLREGMRQHAPRCVPFCRLKCCGLIKALLASRTRVFAQTGHVWL